MSEKNGQGLVSWLEDRKQQLGIGSNTGSIMSDWNTDYPALRLFLLGERTDMGIVLPGSMSLRCNGSNVELLLHCDQFGYIARYTGKSVPGLLEQCENDLQDKTVPFEEDSRTKRQLRQKYALR